MIITETTATEAPTIVPTAVTTGTTVTAKTAIVEIRGTLPTISKTITEKVIITVLTIAIQEIQGPAIDPGM